MATYLSVRDDKGIAVAARAFPAFPNFTLHLLNTYSSSHVTVGYSCMERMILALVIFSEVHCRCQLADANLTTALILLILEITKGV